MSDIRHKPANVVTAMGGMECRLIIVAPDSDRITKGARLWVLTEGEHAGKVMLQHAAGTVPMPAWATVMQDEVMGERDDRLVAISYPSCFSVGLFDPRLCTPARSIASDPKPAITWRTDPPEWAAYVSSVVAIDRDDALHLAIDMRSKRVECHTEMARAGEVVVVFYATPSTMGEAGRDQIVWPPDLGPWPETPTCPTLIINFDDRGRDLDIVGMQGHGTCPNTACPHRYIGRYEVHISLVRRVDWQDEAAVQEVVGP